LVLYLKKLTIMKKLGILFFFSAFIFASCGTDEDNACTKDDWIGTYTLDASSENCADPTTVSLNETVVVAEGTSSGTLNYEGLNVEFDGCTINQSTFQFSATLNGTVMTISGFGCTGTYNKN